MKSGRTENMGKSNIVSAPETLNPDNTFIGGAEGFNQILKGSKYITDILDALPFYVLLIDENHYILQANKAVQAELNFTPEEIVGKYCPKVVHGCDHCYEGCPLEESIERGEAVEKEIYDTEQDRWVLSSVYPTARKTPEGKKIFLHTVLDITKRKEAEERARESHQRLRLISKHLESVQEEERRRIARDLHDETSQLVTGLAAYLEAIVGLLPETDGEVKTMISKAKEISGDILGQIHSIIHELHPALLEKLGLVAAVRSLIENNLKARNIEVSYATRGREEGLPYDLKITLYRIIQEAFSNIVRHADASKVDVGLFFKESTVTVRISDDGRGFNMKEIPETNNRKIGFGLMSMQERVALLDGIFNINSRPGFGTEVKAEIPLAPKVNHG